MARESNEARLQRIHEEALAEFDEIQRAQQDERLQCLEDRRFYSISGAQWEGAIAEQFDAKPRFEFNKVHLAVIRVVNEYRNNRITVDFQPRDGTPDDKLADACDGLYRADERACTAEEAYDNAFEEGTAGGFGAWRLRACYEDEEDDDNEKQRVRIEPIFDADSTVFFDLGAKRQDKADAKRCYVLVPYTRDAFKEEFGHDPSSWDKAISRCEFDWVTPDIVWVCEHYRLEERRETVLYFRGLDEEAPEMKVTETDIENDPELLDELSATGFRVVRRKRVERREVRKYLLSGLGVEEDCGRIAGKHIPIVPFYGKRWVVDGVERCMGHVRLAKDAQRLYNMLLSWLADMAGRFDIEKPIVTPEQIAGHATRWAEDNVKKYPYLLLNGIEDQNGLKIPPQNLPYTKAPQIPPAMAALAQIASQALTDMLGNQQAGEEIQPNISGKAVELIQQRLDMQSFIYLSNLAKSHKRSGEIWLSMMREIVPERSRRMKTVDVNGGVGSVVMNEPRYDAEKAMEYLSNDISKASFDIDVEVGPSSSSRRAAVVRALTGVAAITEDPDTKQALNLATIANLEGEGLADLREWARARGIRTGVIKPNEEEQAQLEAEAGSRQPDPNTVLALQLADQAAADATKKRAETLETVESANLKRAQTRKTLAEAGASETGAILSVAQAVRDAAVPPPGFSL